MLNHGMSRRRLVALTLSVVIALVGASCSGSDRVASSVTGEPEPPAVTTGPVGGDSAITLAPGASAVMSGIAVPGGNPESLERVETAIGTDVGVIRVFARWNTEFPDADHQKILDSGHRMHLSVRPRTDSGEVVPWAAMSNAEPGSLVHNQMLDWADQIVEMGPGNYFTLNHEPETRDSAGNGTADEFVAAWRVFVPLVRAAGGADIKMVWVMTGGAFSDGRADLWYPGDDVVDVISTDPYNWYTCQGSERPWVSFQDLVDPALKYAMIHGKPLSVAEFASVEDKADPGRKAEWIRDAASTLASDPYQSGVEYVSWFNVTSPGGTWPDCVWDYDTSTDSAAAFAEMMGSLR